MADLYGWTGRLLRVDLTEGRTWVDDTTRYLPDYIGGYGIALRVAWDEMPPDTGPFDPENLLCLMVGPLTGTLASGAGRVLIAGVAPQMKPSCFSRSGVGGHWGAELKFAGYDGIIVQGRAPEPCYLWISDDTVEIRPADDLWGQGTYSATRLLRLRHGTKTRVMSCGPAGEKLSRIAHIQTETGNAAGQGGFGGVMGSKNLKAVAVRGTGSVPVADPRRLLDLMLSASNEGLRPPPPPRPKDAPPRKSPWSGGAQPAQTRRRKCGFCMTQCANALYMDVPSRQRPGTVTAHWFCVPLPLTEGSQAEEHAQFSSLGLNGWEVGFGIIPWLEMCAQVGLIDEIDGMPIPYPDEPIMYRKDASPVSPDFMAMLLDKIAYRRGPLGDALAEGVCYAAERLFDGKGLTFIDRIYPRRCGETNHWTAHWGTGGNIWWPYWLVPVLQWCVDTRDPASDSTHSYSTHMLRHLPEHGDETGPLDWETARDVCEKVYGIADVCMPEFTYDKPETKVIPAMYHHDWGMVIESMVACERELPRIFSLKTPDNKADTALPAKLFSSVTGIQMDEFELRRAGERIFQLMRALDVRNSGRDRAIDEWTARSMAFPTFTDGVTLDPEQFWPMLDLYYRERGWNLENGWPTRERLEKLGLHDIADGLAKVGRLG